MSIHRRSCSMTVLRLLTKAGMFELNSVVFQKPLEGYGIKLFLLQTLSFDSRGSLLTLCFKLLHFG